MTKFSIIVPVYNVEKYIDDCLKSIEKQTYDDFEVIVVNDGSPDNSQSIIDKYVKKDVRFKSYIKKNGGLSDARNFGVKKARGEYLLFVDSDDDINERLLEEIDKVSDKKIDIVRFQINKIDKESKTVDKSELFSEVSGEEAFIKLVNNSWFVTAWGASYRRKYWTSNKYEYADKRIHEDFGLTPFVYINAKKVVAIEYVGYNYYVRDNSIMTSNDIKKVIKKTEDCLYHFDRLMEMIDDSKVTDRGKKYYKSYIAYSLINLIAIINDKEILNNYMKELNKRNVGSYLIDDTFVRKVRKWIYNKMPNVYVKLFVK